MTKKLTAASLKIQPTPMIQRRQKKVKIGRRRGMGLNLFVSNLFRMNERLPRSKKMTDGEIARQLYNEFKHLSELEQRFHENNPELSNVISKYRSEYNRGRLLASQPPPAPMEVSFPYNERGNAVNTRYLIPRELTEVEKRKRRAKYARYRKAFLEGKKQAKKIKVK